MEVKVSYSKPQLEAAVKHIARYNEHFQGQKDYIRNSILEHMRQIALNPDSWMGGTMGYTLMGDREDEGLDSDTNRIHFEILVDPALCSDLEESDFVETLVKGEPHNEP